MQSVWFSTPFSLFLLFCSSSVWFPSVPFVSLFLQVFITNLKFQFSQSNESFKLICPLDSTACKFLLLLFPGCALFVHLPVVAMSTLLRSISQQQQKNLEGWKKPKTAVYFPIVLTFTNWLVNGQIDFCWAYLHLAGGNETLWKSNECEASRELWRTHTGKWN